jgi:hypothetical protein
VTGEVLVMVTSDCDWAFVIQRVADASPMPSPTGAP